jgi:thiamine biosynthesis protein ThiS
MSHMRIAANGEPREIPQGTTIARFLERAGLPPERVAVEHNGTIVPRDRYAAVSLEDGDRLEVVTLVGGG